MTNLYVLRVLCLVTQSCPALCDPLDCSPSLSQDRLLCPWGFPRQEYWLEQVAELSSRGSSQSRDCTQVSRIQTDSLPFDPREKPWILEWVAYAFSRGSSQPRNWTQVLCSHCYFVRGLTCPNAGLISFSRWVCGPQHSHGWFHSSLWKWENHSMGNGFGMIRGAFSSVAVFGMPLPLSIYGG